MYPRPHCRFTEVEVPSQLADAAVTVLITLDDLSLELRSERPSGTGLLPLHGLHCEHPFRGDAPDGGCPPNRRRPNLPWWEPLRDRFPAESKVPLIPLPEWRGMIDGWHLLRSLTNNVPPPGTGSGSTTRNSSLATRTSDPTAQVSPVHSPNNILLRYASSGTPLRSTVFGELPGSASFSPTPAY